MPRLPIPAATASLCFCSRQYFSFSRRLTPEACQRIARTSPKRRREAERRKTHPTTDRAPPSSSLCLRRRTEEGARRASGGTRSPLGAPPRLSPEALRPAGSTPGHASWDLDSPGVTRLHLSQSRESTSRTGRSTGVNDARSRPDAGRNPACGDHSRSTFESTLAKGPSVNEMRRM
jgi:hypothetical protein